MGILLNLVYSLCHIHSTTFQFDVDNRHTIDKQHYITSTSGCQRMLCLELRLTHNLIDALPCTYFLSIEDSQINFLTVVYLVILIVSLYHHLSAIDKLVHLIRILQIIHLCHNLLHLAIGQRKVTQTIHVSVVVIYDSSPILNQNLFCRVLNNLWFPTMLRKQVCKCLFKIKFLQKRTN